MESTTLFPRGLTSGDRVAKLPGAYLSLMKQSWFFRRTNGIFSVHIFVTRAVHAKGEAHMTTIIAGRFEQQDKVQDVIAEMVRTGFAPERISSFYVNPPGQHNQYPLGGDRDRSPGAKDSPVGTGAGIAGGGVVGAAVGAATAPATGPFGAIAGALVGGHIGGLVGSLSKMADNGEAVEQHKVAIRQPGIVVAVSVPEPASEDRAIELLRAQGADDIERADGTIVDGDWKDFDPVAPPSLVQDGRVAR
jgi:hypothetical protein